MLPCDTKEATAAADCETDSVICLQQLGIGNQQRQPYDTISNTAAARTHDKTISAATGTYGQAA